MPDDINDVVSLVAGQNFTDASSIITNTLQQKIAVALDDQKKELAHSMFTPQE